MTCLYSQGQLEDTMVRILSSLRDATQMTIMRWFIYKGVKERLSRS